jgi:hypothetical protein
MVVIQAALTALDFLEGVLVIELRRRGGVGRRERLVCNQAVGGSISLIST